MSDIKPGDLVVKVRPAKEACPSMANSGIPFVVTNLDMDGFFCRQCGKFHIGLYANTTGRSFTGALVSSLKKIDPPSEGDSLPTRKDLEEPA